jgi:hypothetical protein
MSLISTMAGEKFPTQDSKKGDNTISVPFGEISNV